MPTSDDIRQLRAKIFQAVYRGSRIDGEGPANTASVIASNVLRSGEVAGLSGEDIMTILAFEALKCVETLVDCEIRRTCTEPAPRFVVLKDMPL